MVSDNNTEIAKLEEKISILIEKLSKYETERALFFKPQEEYAKNPVEDSKITIKNTMRPIMESLKCTSAEIVLQWSNNNVVNFTKDYSNLDFYSTILIMQNAELVKKYESQEYYKNEMEITEFDEILRQHETTFFAYNKDLVAERVESGRISNPNVLDVLDRQRKKHAPELTNEEYAFSMFFPIKVDDEMICYLNIYDSKQNEITLQNPDPEGKEKQYKFDIVNGPPMELLNYYEKVLNAPGLSKHFRTLITHLKEEQLRKNVEQKNTQLEQTLADLKEAQEREKHYQLIAANEAFNLGLKHELNQDLATLTSNLFMLMSSQSIKSIIEESEYYKTKKFAISSSLKAITEKVSYMKDKKEKSSLEKINLYETVMQATKKYADQIQINIDVPKKIEVYWNKQSAAMVLDNLLQNAKEALTQKKEKRIDICGKTNNKVILSIKDYGCGMDEKTKNEAFIPGKSTKGVGENSRHRGQGLFFVLNAVYAADGDIHMDTKPEEYTDIKLIFNKTN